MRYRPIITLILLLTGCATGLRPREELQTQWSQHPIIAPQLPTEQASLINRSLTNDDLDITGTYSGTLINHDTISGAGTLTFSGYFGLADEPVSGHLQGIRLLYEESIAIDVESGSLLFGPRNIHNTFLTGNNAMLPLPTVRVYTYHMLNLIPAISDLELTHSTTDTHYITTSDGSVTGRGNHKQLILTGTYEDSIWTGTLQHDTWTITHNDHTIEYHHTPKSVIMRHLSPWSSTPDRDCDLSSDRSFGRCVIAPPAGDAFTSQAPLLLEWSTHLASGEATRISD